MTKDLFIYFFILCVGVFIGWICRGASIDSGSSNGIYLKPAAQNEISNEVNSTVGEDVVEQLIVEEPEVLDETVGAIIKPPTTEEQSNEIDKTNEKRDVNFFMEFKNLLSSDQLAEASKVYLAHYLDLNDSEKDEWIKQWLVGFANTKNNIVEHLDEINSLLNVTSGHEGLIVAKIKILKLSKPLDELADILQTEASYITDYESLAKVKILIGNLRQEHISKLMNAQRYNELVSFIKECILKEPESYQYYFQLGALLKNLRNEQEAVYYLEMVPGDTQFYLESQKLLTEIKGVMIKDQKSYLGDNQEIRIPLDFDGKNYYVQVKIGDNHTVSLLVDTGASICMIPDSVAREVTGHVGMWQSFSIFKTANGLVKKPLVMFDYIQVGPIKAKKMMFSVDENESNGVPGLLGMNFLSYFNFEIKTNEKVLVLRAKH